MRWSLARARLKTAWSVRGASVPKKDRPLNEAWSWSRNSRRKSWESTCTGRKKPGRQASPARAISGQAAAGDQTMNVRMVLQGLAPAVHHRDDADLGAEMTRIGGDRAQRLGRGAEKNGVNRRLILECDCGDLGRYGEDDVEIRHRKQFGLPVGEPLGPRLWPGNSQ